MDEILTIMLLGLYGFLIIVLFKIFSIERKIGSMGKKSEYDATITVWKFFKQLIFGGASFIVLETLSNFLTALQQWKSVGIIFLIAVLNAINNYIKNR